MPVAKTASVTIRTEPNGTISTVGSAEPTCWTFHRTLEAARRGAEKKAGWLRKVGYTVTIIELPEEGTTP